MNLTWTTSASADDDNHDQETDLTAIGCPGGAVWASVAPDSRVLPGYGPWAWVIYNRWNDVDDHDCELAAGPANSEDEAKAAVANWAAVAARCSWSAVSAIWQAAHGGLRDPRTASAVAYLEAGAQAAGADYDPAEVITRLLGALRAAREKAGT